jgi:hypothetical protein
MKHRRFLPLLVAVAAWPALAAELAVKIEIPQLQVAEYHRPYIALWLEKADGGQVTQLAVWYDQKKKDNGGTKWLKDLRQWWRKGGRDLAVPLDAVTSATRAPGLHNLTYVGGKAPIDKLAAGDYTLFVEAAREGGGREVVRLPLAWPPKDARSASGKGLEELGNVTLQLKP